MLTRLNPKIVLTLLSIMIAGCGLLTSEPYIFNGIEFEDPEKAPNFALNDHNRSLVTLGDLRGKVVLMFFGFTNCPDACPATLGTWKHVYELLEDDASKVEFIMITVDPERDTPEVLEKHLALFNPDFVGLHGSIEEIQGMSSDYNIYFEKAESGSAGGYLVDHSSLSYVIDTEGYLVLGHRSYEISPMDIVSDIKEILDRPSGMFDDN